MRLLILSLLLATSASAQGTGTLAGRVLESDGVTSVIGASVRIEGTELGAATNIDGDYRITDVPFGTYIVTASFVGLDSQMVSGIDIAAGSTRSLVFTLSSEGLVYDSRFYGCTYQLPLITADVYAPRTLTGEEIEVMPLNR